MVTPSRLLFINHKKLQIIDLENSCMTLAWIKLDCDARQKVEHCLFISMKVQRHELINKTSQVKNTKSMNV